MHRAIALAVLAFLSFAPIALAQTAPAPPGQGADAPPESRIAAAIDLLRANHSIDNMNAVTDALTPQLKAQFKQQAPSLSDDAVAVVVQKIHDIIMARQDELLRLYAIEYAQHFSEQELQKLAAFYRSALGQKYIDQIPLLVKENTPIMNRWVVGVLVQERQNILQSLPKPEKKT